MTITAITNRAESFHGLADWLGFGAQGGVIAHNDPVYQEKLVKFNQLIANCALYSAARDITVPPTHPPETGTGSAPMTWPPSPR